MEGDQGTSLLRNGRFVRLWISDSVSFAGDALSIVALPLLAYELTGRASTIGAVLAIQLLPTLASPAVGVLADRLDRRIILVASNLARAVLTLGLFFVEDVGSLYVLAFLLGITRTFFSPTILASIPGIVGDGDLARANALLQGSFNVAIAVGPVLGGLLVSAFGLGAAFLLDAASFLISAALLVTIPIPRGEREETESFWQELGTGFRYLAGARVSLGIIAGAFLGVLANNLTAAAEVLLAQEVFRTGEAGYGLLISVTGIGMITGTALVAAVGARVNPTFLYLSAFFVVAVALFSLGVVPVFPLALVAVGVMGFAVGILNVTEDTVLQKRVPKSLLGRVFAVHFFAFNAGDGLGLFLGGLLVSVVGIRPTYLLAGAAMCAVGLLILWLTRTSGEPR